MRISNIVLFGLSAVLIMGCMMPVNAETKSFYKSNFSTIDGSFWYVSNGWANGTWQGCEWRNTAVTAENGNLELTLSDHGGSQRALGCAEIRSLKAPGYGLYEARMRTAAGSGLNTAFFTYTGPANKTPWDEIDFEFLGKDTHAVSLNVYTNGKSVASRVVDLGFDSTQEFHNYAIDWEPTQITWYVEGKSVFVTPANTPMPTHPGQLFFSLWSGSSEENGWLGPMQYTKPVTADIAWAGYTPSGQKCAFPQSISCNK